MITFDLGPLLPGPMLKVLITHLVLYLEFYNVKPSHMKSSDVFGVDLGPLLQDQMRIAIFKSAYNSFILGTRGLQCETSL